MESMPIHSQVCRGASKVSYLDWYLDKINKKTAFQVGNKFDEADKRINELEKRLSQYEQPIANIELPEILKGMAV